MVYKANNILTYISKHSKVILNETKGKIKEQAKNLHFCCILP